MDELIRNRIGLKWPLYFAGWGLAAWIAQHFLLRLGFIEQVILLATWVYVPACLYLMSDQEKISRVFQVLVVAHPIAASLLLVALMPTANFMAGAPWLLWTALMALHGVMRLMDRRNWVLSEIAISIGCLYIFVGGNWLVVSRISPDFLGFAAPIPLLTAMHFHYAGFILPIYLGLLGRLLDHKTRLYQWPTITILGCVMLLAVGITFSRVIEAIAVFLLLLSVLSINGVLMRQILPRVSGLGVRILLLISGLSLIVALSLSCVYTVGRLTGVPLYSIPQMLSTHGILNSVGFAFCGLLALVLLHPWRMNDAS